MTTNDGNKKRGPVIWAVQKGDTDHKKWEGDTLIYAWEKVELTDLSNEAAIKDEITRQYKNADIMWKVILRDVDAIIKYSKLALGDEIICFESNHIIVKYGKVVSIENTKQDFGFYIKISIEWSKEPAFGFEHFDTNGDIQYANKRHLNISMPDIKAPEKKEPDNKSNPTKFKSPNIQRPNRSSTKSGAQEKLVTDDLSGGETGSGNVNHNPMPVDLPDNTVSSNDKNKAKLFGNLFPKGTMPILPSTGGVKAGSPIADNGGVMTVFYGTNRNASGLKTANDYYGDEVLPDAELKMGTCTVSIPKGHVPGVLERPKSYWLYKFPENPKEHFVLEGIDEMKEAEFLERMKEGIDLFPEKAALIFIHGYNNSFAEAAWRTAQIARDTSFKGISGFFSWPSAGKVVDYLRDGDNAEASVPYFEQFLKSIIENTGVETLHLIAHSMGNRIMAYTLKNLSITTFAEKLKVIHQVILGAPDIDQNVFRNTLLPQLKEIGKRRTIYSSDKDKALHISEEIRRGLPRLGEAGKYLFIADKIDTIDASNVKDDGNHHSYIFKTHQCITDIFLLLRLGVEPQNRNLMAQEKNKSTYWLFPEYKQYT
jgi:esterase/lipase superfamily enzyme